ncbi:type II toxin-antitoxin system HicB family antitoxin [Halomonas binhaiensis]|jgi:predicted RNase H-like HicB family nuclease|uniref:Type II toxin-antitoxin system HicB family antitoxin n=1 Tax=Halomonas binhaiensis TaxID=2562282 RepID=A0A5C1NF43_9GAMM|nr:type II toxin-antitoxin system HicB family antitoxin [Halomonas binhaiensis]QEM80289.1 type II toxin-antitoxin system HicB family antitoxin [Halomonas binhaiensis]
MYYPIAIEPGDDTTAFGVVVPDIPGCFSAGDTFDAAIANAREAIEGHLECLAESGESIPTASSIGNHMKDPEYEGWIWAAVEVDIAPYLGKSHKINVTLPELLIHRIDRLVELHPGYGSRSGFLATAALHELERPI